MKLSEIARALRLKLETEDREINRIDTLERAKSDELSFIGDDKYLDALKTTNAAAVFVRENQKGLVPARCAAIVCDDPYLAFARATAFFSSPLIKEDGKKAQIGKGTVVSDTARIGQDTIIGKNCTIMAGVSIGDEVFIGDDSTIFPNAVIYNRTEIGHRARIHAGAVIGSDGFGYAHTKTGEHIRIRHLGRVVIEDDVEIGANTAIDRAVLGETIIRKGTKIDNLVHIAHNCEIGAHSLITAGVVFAGSVKTGRNLVVAGQSGFAGHLEVADFVTLAARSGVTKSVKKSGVYSGFPLMEHGKWLRLQAKISRLLKKPQGEK